MNLVKLAEQILLSSFFGVCFWCISSILVTTQHLSQILLLCDTRGDTRSFPHTCPSSPRNSLNCYLTPNFLQSFHRHHIWHCSSLAAFTQTSSQLFNAAREKRSGLETKIHEEITYLLAECEAKADKEFDVSQILHAASSNITAHSLFGMCVY